MAAEPAAAGPGAAGSLSVYSELLKLALAEEPPDDGGGPSVPELMQSLESLRERLGGAGGGSAPRPPELPAPERLADQLAYDLALIRACRLLGVPEDLTGGGPVGPERERVEWALAEAWPAPGR